jgi:outer membrane protein, multidrug efflux system
MNPLPLMKTLTFSSLTLLLLAGGCSVGPNFHRPAPLGNARTPDAFAGMTLTNSEWKTAAPVAHLPRGAWWEIFNDPELNRLEALAATNNQQLAASLANLEQARAQLGVSQSGFFPQLTLGAGDTRQRTSENSLSHSSTTYSSYSVPLSASWELDLWGRVRRTVEGSRARMNASQDDLESLKLSIQSTVASSYFTMRAYEAQIHLLRETAVTYGRSLKLTQDRRAGGIASELDVSQAETQLRSAEAQIPALQLQRSNVKNAMAVLCGQTATTFEIADSASSSALPTIPAGIPSEVLEHRPDVAGAERRMAAANADIGVACGAFFPTVTLNGMAGFQSVGTSTLFDWESRVWSLGPSLSLPIFNAGKNRAQLASSKASYAAAVANYRQTVLSAFQDVENQLAAQRLLSSQFEAENAAMLSAQRTLDISLDRYKGGVVTYLEVATAQNASLSHQESVVQLNASRLNAAVSLIKALGAGWEPPKQ